MLPGMEEPLKFKQPYGYNTFSYTGVALHDLIFDPRQTAMGTSIKMLAAIMNSWNPLQGSDVMDTVTPTAAKPYFQSNRNLDYAGRPIKPDYPFDQYDRPESQKYWKSTNPVMVEFMRVLNEATGGDETHAGAVDISPVTANHYIKWVFGGAGATASRAVSSATNLATGEPIDTNNIPIWRTLFVSKRASYDTNRFYEAIKQVAAVEKQIKLYKGTDRYGEYKADNLEVHNLAIHVTKYKNDIKKLRDKRDKAYVDKDTELGRDYGEQIRQKMMMFSKKYDDAVELQQ